MKSSAAMADAGRWDGFCGRCASRAAAQTSGESAVGRDILSFSADILSLRGWRRMGPVGCFLLAAYVAVVVEPLIHGAAGSSIAALMMPVK